MSEDINIEIHTAEQEMKQENTAEFQLPMNILSFGEISNDDVKVYIKQNIYNSLEKYSLADVEHERGTIILGDYCEYQGKIHVVISNSIEAKYTDASASTLTFTHETWDYVHKVYDSEYPDKKIIGWQHTHPGYGIFLSNYDMFIQENFFNLPFQIAYVIDPVQNIRGFFQWKNGKVEKLNGFYIYDDVGKSIKIEQNKIDEKKQESKPLQNGKPLIVLTAVMAVAIITLAIITLSLNSKYLNVLKLSKNMENELSLQTETIDSQQMEISELQNKLLDGVTGENGKAVAEYLLEQLENNEITVDNRETVISELKALIEKGESSEGGLEFISYSVKSGDTLLSICTANSVDYYANKNIILALNGIDDQDNITVGQNILLPIIN